MFQPPRLIAAPSFVLLAAFATPAASQNPEAEWQAFLRLPAAKRAQAAKDLEQSLPQSPLVQSLRAAIAATFEPSAERTKRLAERQGKRVFAKDDTPDVSMPQAVRYIFGIGTLELRSPGSAPSSSGSSSIAQKKGQLTAAPTPEEATIDVEQALLGLMPGADRALANLLLRLDQDTTADEFAAFLHSWRNGDESFYEALDRTAGTKDSVFFYDV
ncbi:MAG: hypothetical protein ABIP94_22845, partial [Planctomycetota bacterium]